MTSAHEAIQLDEEALSSYSASCSRAIAQQGAAPDANGERLCLHSFRHTYLTRLADSGVPVHKVQRIAGHAQLATTLKYFTVADADLHDDIDRAFAACDTDYGQRQAAQG